MRCFDGLLLHGLSVSVLFEAHRFFQDQMEIAAHACARAEVEARARCRRIPHGMLCQQSRELWNTTCLIQYLL